MTVAIADVGCRGRLNLIFGVRGGRTIIRDSYCEVPFKITRLLDSRPPAAAHLILMHCTAGIFGGDELQCTIHVESGANVRITQQSSTKIHPSGPGLADRSPAQQTTHIKVDEGAQLVFECEPTIPFAGSRFRQKTLIEAQPGARVAFWESMMAGRVGMGEQWQFEEYSSETRLEVNQQLVHMDRYSLMPRHQNIAERWLMSNDTYAGTGLYLGNDASAVAGVLHDQLPDAGIGLLNSQVILARVVAADGPDFHRYRQVWGRAI